MRQRYLYLGRVRKDGRLKFGLTRRDDLNINLAGCDLLITRWEFYCFQKKHDIMREVAAYRDQDGFYRPEAEARLKELIARVDE